VLVPTLTDSGETPPPYWQQHAASLQRALAPIPQERPLVFVGHSAAGSLLPVLAQVAHHPVKAYLFVDAGLPHLGKSRLDEMEASVPERAQGLRQLLASGKRFPNWTNEDLSELLSDGHARQQMLAELQPRPLNFFEEAMPLVPGWFDVPSGYLLFTQGYRHYLEQAQRAGWPNRTLPGGHFHMLVDPIAVSATLVELMKQIYEKRWTLREGWSARKTSTSPSKEDGRLSTPKRSRSLAKIEARAAAILKTDPCLAFFVLVNTLILLLKMFADCLSSFLCQILADYLPYSRLLSAGGQELTSIVDPKADLRFSENLTWCLRSATMKNLLRLLRKSQY
jgi:hypothetical protein